MGHSSDVLITLNAESKLPRATICRLALEIDAWERGLGPAAAISFASELGVPAPQLAIALDTLATARRCAARQRRQADALGATIVTRVDAGYPAMLADLPLPPPVLYVRGALPPLPGIAIVGSRRVDAYGAEAAGFFARDLAARGLAVVSGFAVGADAAAHRGALAGGGSTVAVLGCGLGIDYPAGHRPLGDAIASTGAVISEFPCARTPQSWHFPVRNRIIAALAHGTLVIQATPRSGSLVSARLAMELGRDVYALPGRIFDERSLGPNGLIRDGAILVQHPQDIVDSLPEAARRAVSGACAPANAEGSGLDGLAGELLACLVPGQPAPPEELAAATERPVEVIQGALVELELAGFVRRLPGGVYARRA
jgi:DNA processing protein